MSQDEHTDGLGLSRLPPEVCSKVADQLQQPRDLCNLGQTCKEWHGLCNTPAQWTRLYKSHFPGQPVLPPVSVAEEWQNSAVTMAAYKWRASCDERWRQMFPVHAYTSSEQHEQWINGVSINAQHRVVVSASADGRAMIWSLAGERLQILGDGTASFWCSHSSGNYAVAGCMNGCVHLWDVPTGVALSEWADQAPESAGIITSTTLTTPEPNSPVLVTSLVRGAALYDPRNAKNTPVWRASQTRTVRRCFYRAAMQDHVLVVCGSLIELFDTRMLREGVRGVAPQQIGEVYNQGIDAFSCSLLYPKLMTGHMDGTVALWDLGNTRNGNHGNEIMGNFGNGNFGTFGNSETAYGIVQNAQGNASAVPSRPLSEGGPAEQQGPLRMVQRHIRKHIGDAFSVMLTHDWRAMSAAEDGVVHLYDVSHGSLQDVGTLVPGSYPPDARTEQGPVAVHCAAMSDSLLVTAGRDALLRFFDFGPGVAL